MSTSSDLGEEASRMLAAALEQMDGIIAGSNFGGNSQNGSLGCCSSPLFTSSYSGSQISDLSNELKNIIEMSSDRKKLLHQVPQDALTVLREWFTETSDSASKSQQTNGLPASSSNDSLSGKLNRLETDKESLTLQVSVITEQVEAQGDKITELQDLLENKQDKLSHMEQKLQNELLNKTTLETHKLDMMAEISNLKLRLASAERDRQEMIDRYNQAQSQINELKTKLNEREVEMVELKSKLARNGTYPDQYTADMEVEKLRKAVESLMVANDDKEKKIEDMRQSMKRYQRLEDILQGQGKKLGLDNRNIDDDNRSDTSSAPSINDTLKENLHIKPETPPRAHIELFIHEDQSEGRARVNGNGMPSPTAHSTPVHTDLHTGSNGSSPAPSTIHVSPTPKKNTTVKKSTSCEDITPIPPKTPPGIAKQGFGGSLPRDNMQHLPSKKGWQSEDEAGNECLTTDDEDPNAIHPKPKRDKKKSKGFKRFFGRMKRSNSQDFDAEDEKPGDFKRGGIRATAGARLGWSKDVKVNELLKVPFARWDSDRVSMWLHEIGLSMYVGECKRWARNGAQLLNATPHDMEKELGIKHPLHRKKLQLALHEVLSDKKEPESLLSHEWVTRWLDDLGLPQYKDVFSEARVDGRMLNHMTVEDLLALKINSALHHMSIKTGIHILRLYKFSPSCLKRRAAPEEPVPTAKEVALWTNHRVMEWLRTIDLSEYAPNLRGSGVHGALIVYEAKFSVDNLAMILSIPSSKTLLRRHLSTHFVELITNDIMQKKREAEMLQLNAKVKSKRGIFQKRGRSASEADDYLCPMETELNGNATKTDPKTAKQYSTVSKEINTLTNMIEEGDLFIHEGPTSNV